MRFDILSILDLDSRQKAFDALPASIKDELTPKFDHDCDCCQFLGHHKGHDLYACTGTVIARKGSNGPDYVSGLVFATQGTILGEAKKRAERLGIEF